MRGGESRFGGKKNPLGAGSERVGVLPAPRGWRRGETPVVVRLWTGWVDGGAPRPAARIQWLQLCRLLCQESVPARTARIGRTMRMKLRKAITSIRLGRLSGLTNFFDCMMHANSPSGQCGV